MKTNYKKTILLLTVTLMLFTGCAGAPLESATQTEETAPQSADQGPYTLLREAYGMGSLCNDTMFFGPMEVLQNGDGYFSYIDMQAMEQRYFCFQEGCTHSTPSCNAYQKGNRAGQKQIICVTEDTLYWASGDQYAPGYLCTTDLQGKNEQYLYGFGNDMQTIKTQGGESYSVMEYNWGSSAIATDGVYYYDTVIHTSPAENENGQQRTTELWKIDSVTGNHEVLYTTQPDNGGIWQALLMGCTADTLILDEQIEGDTDTGSLSGNAAAVQHNIILLAQDGTTTPVFSFKGGDYAATAFRENLMYAITADRTAMLSIDFITGETKTITQNLPVGTSCYFVGIYEGKALVSVFINEQDDIGEHIYLVDLQTGTMEENTLKRLHNGGDAPIWIGAETQDDFLVIMEARPIQRTGLGTDGVPYTWDSELELYAMIDKDDYFANVPNYREIKMLPQS